jgi:hypothetical protein
MDCIRRAAPHPIRQLIRQSGLHHRLRHYLDRFLLLRPFPSQQTLTIDMASVHNVLPNDGPIPVKQMFESAKEIIDQHQDASRRRLGIEGFAADDAVFDAATQKAEMWSYAPLAGVLAKMIMRHNRPCTCLELGCGPAHLFFFLRRFGIYNYVGI